MIFRVNLFEKKRNSSGSQDYFSPLRIIIIFKKGWSKGPLTLPRDTSETRFSKGDLDSGHLQQRVSSKKSSILSANYSHLKMDQKQCPRPCRKCYTYLI